MGADALSHAVDDNAARRVRAMLLRVGYTVDGLQRALGDAAWAAVGRDDSATIAREIGDPAASPLASLVHAFLLGRTISPHHDVDVDSLCVLRIADWIDGQLVPHVEVRPYGQQREGVSQDWWVVSDFAALAGRPLAADHVLGVGGASLTLAHLTPRTPVGRALDIGTGCGVQALHLAQHAAAIVATDTNPRALWATQISAALSDVPLSIDVRQGSLLDPVAGETFDLIVSNPPFVISPRAHFEYRDAGMPADDVGRILVRDLPDYLNPGGMAVLLANWLHVIDEDWAERVTSWVRDRGLQAWIVQRDTEDPATYVHTWLQDSSSLHREDTDQVRADWLAGLDAMRTEAIGFGWIVLRRVDDALASMIAVEDHTRARRLPDGGEVMGALDVQRALAELDAFALLDSVLTIADGVTIAERTVHLDGRWHALGAVVSDSSGWRAPVEIDAIAVALLRRCNGSMTLRDIVEQVSDIYDGEDVLISATWVMRHLLRDGILVRH